MASLHSTQIVVGDVELTIEEEPVFPLLNFLVELVEFGSNIPFQGRVGEGLFKTHVSTPVRLPLSVER